MPRETGIHVQGVNQLLRTMNKMGKEMSNYARDSSTDLAEQFLSLVRSDASTETETAAAAILRVYRDRVPKVGFPAGTRVAVSGNPKIGEFFYGVEFGGPSPFPNGGARFRTHTGTDGYFFYDTLRTHGERIAFDWFDEVMGEMSEDWNAGAAKARR